MVHHVANYLTLPFLRLGYPAYWKAAMKMSKKGSMIIGDNVVRQGRIADPENKDE